MARELITTSTPLSSHCCHLLKAHSSISPSKHHLDLSLSHPTLPLFMYTYICCWHMLTFLLTSWSTFKIWYFHSYMYMMHCCGLIWHCLLIVPSDTVYLFNCQALSPLPQAHISSLASSEPNSTIKIMHKVPMSPTFHQMGTWGCNNLSCLTFSGIFMLSDGFHLI